MCMALFLNLKKNNATDIEHSVCQFLCESLILAVKVIVRQATLWVSVLISNAYYSSSSSMHGYIRPTPDAPVQLNAAVSSSPLMQCSN